ncbi:hypothetical protein [Actinomadura hibisca]|uniref:hypothetical protein n=1 Tax=Actinomadura hibisca TaxID=68565 RepID=UPI00082AB4E2|nr:hypothetical protein [Actinomadura hibisca]
MPPLEHVAVATFRAPGRTTVLLYPVIGLAEDDGGGVVVQLASGAEGPADPEWTVCTLRAARAWLHAAGFEPYRTWPGTGCSAWIRTFPDEVGASDGGGGP